MLYFFFFTTSPNLYVLIYHAMDNANISLYPFYLVFFVSHEFRRWAEMKREKNSTRVFPGECEKFTVTLARPFENITKEKKIKEKR